MADSLAASWWAPHIGDYRVDLDRGAFTSHAYEPEGELLDEQRAIKLLTHVSRDCGSNGDPDDLKYGILYALEAGTARSGDQGVWLAVIP